MAYCDAGDVARYNLARGTYTASTKPTASQVSLFIDEIAGEIDLTLRTAGYIVPVPSSYGIDFEFLRGVNAVGAAWKVELAAPTSDNEGMYQQMYHSAMKMMGHIDLQAPKDTSVSMPRSGFGAPGQGPIFGIASHPTRTKF